MTQYDWRESIPLQYRKCKRRTGVKIWITVSITLAVCGLLAIAAITVLPNMTGDADPYGIIAESTTITPIPGLDVE